MRKNIPPQKPKEECGAEALRDACGAREELSADVLNERARLYPWMRFTQKELEIMMGLPREAIRRAFRTADVACQFGASRPEEIVKWLETLDKKITTQAVI